MLRKGKHTDIRGQMHESPRMNLSDVLTQVCNKISEQTYPDLLLVKIKTIYPHQESKIISSFYG